MPLPEVKLLLKKNYLAMIRNAAKGENHMFRNFHITIDGIERDALDNGALGCGTVASSVLYLQNSTLEFLKKPKWIGFVHAAVPALEKDIAEHGWVKVPELREGALIVWEARMGQEVPVYGNMHFHIGFYLGNDRAMSNGSNSTLMPREHDATDGGKHNIVRVWWHPALDDEQ